MELLFRSTIMLRYERKRERERERERKEGRKEGRIRIGSRLWLLHRWTTRPHKIMLLLIQALPKLPSNATKPTTTIWLAHSIRANDASLSCYFTGFPGMGRERAPSEEYDHNHSLSRWNQHGTWFCSSSSPDQPTDIQAYNQPSND